MSEPKIPFGYRVVTGQSQKGDGIWNGVRFAKVKKVYPQIAAGQVAIRRQEVVQTEMQGVAQESAGVEEWE